MTDPNKAAVLAKWPDAYTFDNGRWGVVVYARRVYQGEIVNGCAPNLTLGHGNTEPEAWADAARRLK